jgi:hypothetical protein
LKTRRLTYVAAGIAGIACAIFWATRDELVLGAPAQFERLARAPFGPPAYRGNLESPALTEASGLAASRLQDDLMWTVNDSGHDPVLYAIGSDGRDRGSLRIEGAKNNDWEDIASFRFQAEGDDQERAYLLIADIGDNTSRRKKLTLYAIEEPPVPGARLPEAFDVPVWLRQKFRFEDGPRDAEAVAIDLEDERILIVSKRKVPAEVYELSLRDVFSGSEKVLVATRVALLSAIPQPTPADVEEDSKYGRHRSQPTAFDIAADGRSAVVLTYKHAYHYPRAEGESWEKALARDPQLIAVPPMLQTEAGAFDRSGESFFVTSERRPAPLFEIPRM